MKSFTAEILLLLPLSLASLTLAKSTKRGVSVLGENHNSDWSLLTAAGTPLSWYWNWSPYAANASLVSALEFVPQIHDLDNIDKIVAQVLTLSENSTSLLTFNEPDGSTSTGGSGISASDAAAAYIKNILPLRKGNGGRFAISHPATTGSPQGLTWLQDFNTSCYKKAPKTGCPIDFIATHWYGNFIDMTSWLETLNTFYNVNTSRPVPLKIWLTEVDLPQADEATTVEMLNQTLPWLETQTMIERYAWFGMFRTNEANSYTGENVAMFDKSGGLTQLGAMYMNGVAGNGTSAGEGVATFKEGQKGTAKDVSGSATMISMPNWSWTIIGMAWILLR